MDLKTLARDIAAGQGITEFTFDREEIENWLLDKK